MVKRMTRKGVRAAGMQALRLCFGLHGDAGDASRIIEENCIQPSHASESGTPLCVGEWHLQFE